MKATGTDLITHAQRFIGRPYVLGSVLMDGRFYYYRTKNIKDNANKE